MLVHWKMKCNYRVVLGTRRAERVYHPPEYRYFYSYFTFCAAVGLRFFVPSFFDSYPKVFDDRHISV
jgi:hypothetical protein